MTIVSAIPALERGILILSDGKMGDLAQCRGVALHLGGLVREHVVEPGPIARRVAPWGPMPPDPVLQAISEPPAVVLASGRRTASYLRGLKRRFGAKTVTVFLKDPRSGAGTADLIWIPTHDRLRADNVVVTDTAPHGLAQHIRDQAAGTLQERLGLNRDDANYAGLILGGATRDVNYPPSDEDALVEAVREFAGSATKVLATASRRTPTSLVQKLREALPSDRFWLWDGGGANPYPGILGLCSAFLVTGDSHNMVSEALSTGKQVQVFRPQGLPDKFTRFLYKMSQNGLIAEPGPADFSHQQEPIDATPTIARAILERLA